MVKLTSQLNVSHTQEFAEAHTAFQFLPDTIGKATYTTR